MDLVIRILKELMLIVMQVGIIICILYLLWHFRWKPWIEEGKRRYHSGWDNK